MAPAGAGQGHWLLARRSLVNPWEFSLLRPYGPARTTFDELVRVAGIRWATEECFEEAKGQVGLDQYEVRRWDGWYRHIILADVGSRFPGGDQVLREDTGMSGGKGGGPSRDRSPDSIESPRGAPACLPALSGLQTALRISFCTGPSGYGDIRPERNKATTKVGWRNWQQ